MSMLDHALEYARRGWPVFPCDGDKQPLVARVLDESGTPIPRSGGLYRATTDAEIIREWWTKWPDAMIGFPCGPASGVWGLDPDVAKKPGDRDGLAYWQELVAKHGGLPPTHSHRTPSGGLHRLFRWREDKPVSNKEGKLKHTGINVRGNGGYMIVPPSRRADGKAYEMEEPQNFLRFADAPEWLYDLILPPEEQRPAPTLDAQSISQRARAAVSPLEGAFDKYVQTALEGEWSKVASAPSGGRNNELNASAFSLGTLVGAGILSADDVETTLLDASRQNCLVRDDGERAVLATIKSGLQAGMGHPRALPARGLVDSSRFDELIARATVASAAAEVSGHAVEVAHDTAIENGLKAGMQTPRETPERRAEAPPRRKNKPKIVFWDGDPANPKAGPALIKDMFPERGTGEIAGQSGVGKTFVELDLSRAVATGAPFFGRKVRKRGGVLMLVAEAPFTIEPRINALKIGHGLTDPLPIAWMPVSGLSQPGAMEALEAEIKIVSEDMKRKFGVDLALITIDTMAAAFEFKNADGSDEVQKAWNGMNALALSLGLLIIGVHHFGKDIERGPRGSSSFTDGPDAIVAILGDRTLDGKVLNRRISQTKSRDGATGWTCPWTLEVVELGKDEDGDPITSGYVVPEIESASDTPSSQKKSDPKLSRSVRAFMAAFRQAIGDKGKKVRPYGFEGPEVVAVERDELRAAFYENWPADGDTEKKRQTTRRQRFNEAEHRAIDMGLVKYHEDGALQLFWLCDVAAEIAALAA